MKRLAWMVLVLGVALSPQIARADKAPTPPRKQLDPTVADDDVKAVRTEGHDFFCKAPEKPLTPRAHALCGLAKDIPDCPGFADACAGAEAATSKLKKPEMDMGSFGEILGVILKGLVYLLLAAGVIALLVPIVMAIMKWRRDRAAADDPAKTSRSQEDDVAIEEVARETDAERLLAMADAHLARGELDRAVVTYLHAALRALDQRGAIRVAKHRTNGEYVRACTDAEAKPPLRSIVRAVDRVAFGGVAPTTESVSEVSKLARALVRAVPIALIALFLSACGPGVGDWSERRGDPAAGDVMQALLERQGMTASRVHSSLATMPMPKDDEEAPTLIVDAEKTPLDEDASEHLARWVEAGGVLVLGGDPESWPKRFEAKRASPTVETTEVVVTVSLGEAVSPADEDEAYVAKAHVARSGALEWSSSEPLATIGGALYAGARTMGKGTVLGLATGELFTNASLARPGNAEALIALLAAVTRSHTFEIAREEDGIAPASNPISALHQAGLGLGLWHALAAAGVLFVAFGVRHARPRPTPPPERRAFTEHVEATGAAYARRRMSGHALAAFTRYADERLRAKMPRGSHDPAAFLAARSGADPAHVAAIWARATSAGTTTQQKTDLQTLRELSALYSRAMKSD